MYNFEGNIVSAKFLILKKTVKENYTFYVVTI